MIPVLQLIFLIFSCAGLYSYPNYSFKHYNINNGLSQNTVRCILQDKTGFMWFGTKDGLSRFDGTKFKIFKFSPDGDLRNNVFHHILEDKNGNIWVATEGGIYIYDPLMEKFERFNGVTENKESIDGWISDLVLDSDGDLWISVEQKGVFHYNFKTKDLNLYPIETVPGGMRIISLCVGRNNDIWVFPNGRPLIRIDKETNQTSEFQLKDDPDFFYGLGEIRNVISDENNQLILPTSNKGLISINTVNKTYRTLLDVDSSGRPIFVRTVKRIDNQTFWVGTESGVYILNTLEGTVVNLRHDNLITGSLSDNAIYSICKDREGGIWVGSYFGGVDYYSEQLNKFELFYPIPQINDMKGSRVREFFPADDGNIWIGTEDNGLNLFNPVTNSFLPLPGPLQSLYTNIHALYKDGDFLWISTFSKGLNRYNLKTGELTTYTLTNDPGSINNNSTFAICKSRQNILWIGTLSGLNTYNYQSNTFTRVEKLKGISIHDIFEDSDGNIWISTFSNGLFRYKPGTSEWTSFMNRPDDSNSLPYNTVTSVFEDSKSRLWITTQGGGFCLFNKKDETFTTFNITHGMPNNVVYQIVEDNEGYLWLSTNHGLVRYNPQSGIFKNYTVDSGLKTNQFNYKSSYKTSDGTIYFGSIDGFVRFNPSTFRELKLDTPIVFTELFVNNELISPKSGKSLLKKSILYEYELTLPYNKNSFRLEYALLNYSNLNGSHVLYRLDGFDKEWIDGSGKRDIVYSNLDPGKYRLTVKLNGEGEHEGAENIKTLIIRIRPPFWKSSWAYSIYLVLFLFSGWAIFHFLKIRSHRIQQNKMQLFEQQKERELYQSKINFFTNVAHEIRTPLTLIKAPLDHVLMTEKVSDNMKDNLQIMSKNTARLLNLTNQLLDFRKTESEAYQLNLQTQNVSNLIRETVLRFTPMAKQNNVTLETALPEQDIFVQLDKEAFLKIVSNLLSNALKYCDRFVRLEATVIENEKREFYLLIENDGELIPHAYKKEIFKPFVQIDTNQDKKVSGTGIGLALASSLAELHGGSLSLESDENFNRFLLKLPIKDVTNVEMVNPEVENNEINIDTDTGAQKKEATLLLVDDDVELLHFEAKFLSAHYHILTAENGVQALKQLKKSTVNLIVTDVMMPEMDGFEFTQKVKEEVEFSHIPVILLTAKVMAQSKVQGYELGADAYLEKPFSVEVLLARIENLLQSREKLRESFLKNPFIGAATVALNKSDEAFIKKLNEVIQENLGDSDFNVEDMAERFSMSRASFYRKVKGVLDLTPNEYIRVERLKKAAQLLKQDDYKINEICYMVGFNSPSYFAKCFQQQFGILPKDFQEQK